ncbi:MAG TPA: cbb3-type cytochrome c oxidase subunit I [Gemmatimonadales bacterium]|nr:cbb3-type cytochrome c oxidase subunit I [Gemmatimonadales bacterium]
MNRADRLPLANFAVAITAFGIASAMAMMQALSRASLDLPFRSPKMYYLSVTAHGVLMALVFTTFFIVGFGYVVVTRTLNRPLATPRLAWTGFWVALTGTALAAGAILSGQASVLYTFYPPLQAHPAFYIGAALLIVGSWCWSATTILTYRAWRREHPGVPAPLALHGMLVTAILWLIATVGVAIEDLVLLIPWSLGLTKTIDPMLARMLFWYFGHPLVYFWLLPAYVVWYTIFPRVAGGKLFSDPLGRLVFILFLILSTPVGFHHEFMDPGIPAGWKFLHSMITMWILFPSFVTAFTITASMEVAGRLKGATGWLDWLGKLPWRDPTFSSVAFAMLLFAIGGIGGAINASYMLNSVVHNTAWIQAHFHLTVGSAVALTFMGVSYYLLPRLLGRELELGLLARVQPYLWFIGMALFSFSNHITGLMGMPRRVMEATYGGSPIAAQWKVLTGVSAVGGLFLFASAGCFVLVMLGTWLAGKRRDPQPIEWAEPLHPVAARTTLLDRYGLWTIVAIVIVLIAYAVPLWQHLQMTTYGSPGFKPF